MAYGKVYTQAEMDLIRELYPNTEAKVIAAKLGRSLQAIYVKINHMGLKKTGDKWTVHRLQFLEANYTKMTNKELADALGLRLTTTRTMLYKLGLRRMEMEFWTKEQIHFLKENYHHIGDKEMAQMFQDIWPKKKLWTNKHIEKKRKYLKLKRSDEDRTRIRHRAIAKGTYATANLKRWSGIVSPVGTIKVWKHMDGRPFKVIRTAKGFVHYNRWLWEQKRGPIPEGMVIAYRDGNPLNAVIENLKCVDRGYQYPDSGPVRTDQTQLTDRYVASLLASGDLNLKEYIINEQPELIELKRQQLLLNRAIRKTRKENEHI